jgi:hypothetical protein
VLAHPIHSQAHCMWLGKHDDETLSPVSLSKLVNTVNSTARVGLEMLTRCMPVHLSMVCTARALVSRVLHMALHSIVLLSVADL